MSRPNGERHVAVRNAGDEEQVKKADHAEKRIEYQADNDLYAVMSEAQGRRFVWSQLKALYQNPFGLDPHATAYACGVLAAAQALLADVVRVCPDLYLKAQVEAQIMEKQNDAERQ